MKTFAVILDHMTVLKPKPELLASNSCSFFTSEPHINKMRCLHAPLSNPTRSQTHLPALHAASALSSAHPRLGCARSCPNTSIDLLRTFKLDVFTGVSEESGEKINGRVYDTENNVPGLIAQAATFLCLFLH